MNSIELESMGILGYKSFTEIACSRQCIRVSGVTNCGLNSEIS